MRLDHLIFRGERIIPCLSTIFPIFVVNRFRDNFVNDEKWTIMYARSCNKTT